MIVGSGRINDLLPGNSASETVTFFGYAEVSSRLESPVPWSKKCRVFLGMGDIPPLIGNPYSGYINPLLLG